LAANITKQGGKKNKEILDKYEFRQTWSAQIFS